MKVEMRVHLSGTVNGQEYPSAGQVLDTTDAHGAELCANGLAVPVVSEPVVERAVAPAAEKRTPRKRTTK